MFCCPWFVNTIMTSLAVVSPGWLHPFLQHHKVKERRGCCHKNIQCVIGSTFRSHRLCVQTHVDLNEPNYESSQGSCINLWSTFSTWILTIALNADPNQSIYTIHSDIILFWTKFYAVWYFHHSSFFLNPLCVYFKILTDSRIKQCPMGFIFNPVLHLSQMQTREYKKDISSANEAINLHSWTIHRHINAMNSRDWKHFIYLLCFMP